MFSPYSGEGEWLPPCTTPSHGDTARYHPHRVGVDHGCSMVPLGGASLSENTNTYSLRLRLTGSLIPFTTLAFILQRQNHIGCCLHLWYSFQFQNISPLLWKFYSLLFFSRFLVFLLSPIINRDFKPRNTEIHLRIL